MPYYPSIAVFRTRAPMLDVAKAVVAELGDEFSFACERAGGSLGKDAAREFLRNQKEELSRFGISRSPHHMIFSGPLPSGSLHLEAWDSDRDGSGRIADAVKAEWQALVLRLHRILVRDCGALLSYTSVYDHHYSLEPNAYELGELVNREVKARGAAGLQSILRNSSFFWILGINRAAFGEDLAEYSAELTRYFRIVEEAPEFLVLVNNQDVPIFLK